MKNRGVCSIIVLLIIRSYPLNVFGRTKMNKKYTLPNDLIVLISGVPGVGKTTISYELQGETKYFYFVVKYRGWDND